ncbi:hypothetical protein LP420_07115 [Massilia sp. B-10]|nr:hypothetical protein LP420_07115 [Massilia sp. B-10]
MLALRQAGSTLKPFLYELAIERRLLTAASLMDDSPLDVSTASGLYVPQNYDRQFRGIATRVPAWLGSLNIPAVRTLLLTGQDRFYDRLHALGFDSLDQLSRFLRTVAGAGIGRSVAAGAGQCLPHARQRRLARQRHAHAARRRRGSGCSMPGPASSSATCCPTAPRAA